MIELMNIEGNKVIRREEILDAYINYSRHKGDARVILKQRLEAILFAFNQDLDRDVLKYFNSGILIDDYCSESKIKEIESITGVNLDGESLESSIRKRQALFEALLIYRVKLEDIYHAYDNIFECSRGFLEGANYTRKESNEIMELVKSKVDRVIFLLMGDKYDKSFTVSELKEKQCYPEISDKDLMWIISNEQHN